MQIDELPGNDLDNFRCVETLIVEAMKVNIDLTILLPSFSAVPRQGRLELGYWKAGVQVLPRQEHPLGKHLR